MKEKILSFTETSCSPLSDFSDRFKESHPNYIDLLKTGEYRIITGSGYTVSWEQPHECDCEYCVHTEEIERFFQNKEDAEEFANELNEDIDNEDVVVDEGTYFVKAVLQQPADDCPLFKG